MSSSKILFITSTNLTVNPRLKKEIDLALNNNFKCDIIYFDLGNWSDEYNREILNTINVKSTKLNATRKKLLSWFLSSIIKLGSNVLSILVQNVRFTSFSLDKRSWLIHQVLKRLENDYSLIIGHNPATFYPAYHYAIKKQIPFAIDVEDYHPGETENASQRKKTEFLMKKILPHAACVSYASNPIRQNSLILQKANFNLPNHILLNNSFPSKEFPPPGNVHSSNIKLVWFSQNISYYRGLEQIIQAAKNHCDKIELHLIGNLYPSFKKEWIDPNKDFITILSPMPQEELHKKLSDYDVGLALEPGKDLNNNLAVSNKIYAYAQSGLYILATRTEGQKRFMKENYWAGILCNSSAEDIQMALTKIMKNLVKIREEKKQRYEKAKSLAWEKESEKLLRVWEKLEARSWKGRRSWRLNKNDTLK